MSTTAETVNCRACGTLFAEGETVCSHCGFPQFEGEAAQKQWVKARKARKEELKGYEKWTERGVIPLWIVGILSLFGAFVGIFALIAAASTQDFVAFIGASIMIIIPVSILYVAHYVFRKAPRTALIIGLCLFLVLLGLNLYAEQWLRVGLMVIATGFTGVGLIFEKKARDLREELDIKSGMRLDR